MMKNSLLVIAASLGFLGSAAVPASDALCKAHQFEGADYTICTIAPERGELKLFWKDPSGKPYRSFARLDEAVAGGGRKLVFAMNAGMYSESFAPVGLHVEAGQVLRPLDLKDVRGEAGSVPNFYKKPNGILFFGKNGARIAATDTIGPALPPSDFATQSGPMLVIGGRLHPAFIEGSSDRTRRSGVGLCVGNKLVFAVSEEAVNFHAFARLFRDDLNCPDALFLDGGRGVGLFYRPWNRADTSGHGGYGPMIGLVQ